MSALDDLKNYLKKQSEYNRVTTLLYWDMHTGMPRCGFAGHSDALTTFSTEAFKMSTSEELFQLLSSLQKPEEFEKLDGMWQFIVRRMKRTMDENRRIPEAFYSDFVRAQSESGMAWEEAKRASDFSIFAPHLEKMIAMTKEMAHYVHPEKEVYDALLGNYEEGMDSATIDGLFSELKAELVPLVHRILAAEQPDDTIFMRKVSVDGQRRVQELLLSYIGFSFERGAVGESEHPFTMNFSSQDVRVTNHFRAEKAIDSMFSAIHEGGHAIFEQNVNPDYDETVAGSCEYLGIHESQSRFYENILGRRKSFWVPIYEKVLKELPELSDISIDEFVKEINHVRNSFIRTEADEVTYCLHIILRYEIEKAIFRDNVPVSELPALWNRKMQELLLITPANDAEGILQDMHWSDGSFGYFPTYLLGSIYDGMYLDALTKELGDLDTILSEGRIAEITEWLNKKIHVYGNTRLPKDTIDAVCGVPVSAEPLMRYFREKYEKIYGLR